MCVCVCVLPPDMFIIFTISLPFFSLDQVNEARSKTYRGRRTEHNVTEEEVLFNDERLQFSDEKEKTAKMSSVIPHANYTESTESKPPSTVIKEECARLCCHF